jgi:agmatinase
VIFDPGRRWQEHGYKPDFAGILTYGGLPLTEDATELAGFDVAIVGAPFDGLAGLDAGARFGPRAIRAAGVEHGPHLEAGVDALERLRVVDFGDAPVVPFDAAAAHRAVEVTVAEVVASDTFPLVLGGDHSISLPAIRACAAAHGPLGLIHFDTHTDTAEDELGVRITHGTPMRRLVEEGSVDPARYVQVGLRGYWPGEPELGWQREQGITSFFIHDVRALGIDEVIGRAVEVIGGDAPAYMTVDVDALDPAFAPGTGTPEPGGLSSAELLAACRAGAEGLALVGADVVEVAPTAVGSRDLTALVGDRIVREILTGVALRRGD